MRLSKCGLFSNKHIGMVSINIAIDLLFELLIESLSKQNVSARITNYVLRKEKKGTF